jgi:predicted RNA polymerase sigma factor
MPYSVTPAIEHLLRELLPQVLGAVARRHGDFQAAEDAVQEALIAAAAQWPADGIPRNPRGWLYHVALRRITDHLRGKMARRRREDAVASEVWADWAFVPQILALYGVLERMSDNPVVTLNRVIAVAMVKGPEAGLELLKALDGDPRMRGHYRLDAVRAHLYERAGDPRARHRPLARRRSGRRASPSATT